MFNRVTSQSNDLRFVPPLLVCYSSTLLIMLSSIYSELIVVKAKHDLPSVNSSSCCWTNYSEGLTKYFLRVRGTCYTISLCMNSRESYSLISIWNINLSRTSDSYMRQQNRTLSVQILTWRKRGDKSISEPIFAYCQLIVVEWRIYSSVNKVIIG